MHASVPRVAIVCSDLGIPWLGCGGASSHLRGIASGYVAAGAEVEAWVGRLPPHPGRVSALSPPGVRVRQGPSAPGAFARWVRRQVRSFEPALLHERHSLPDGAGEQAPGVIRLLEVNAPLTWEDGLFRGRRVRRSSLEAEVRALRRADAVAVVSPSLQEWVGRHGVRAAVVPNGVRALRPSDKKPGPFILGFEGSFKVWHGLLEASESLGLLASKLAPRALAIELVGDGPLRPAVQAALPSASWLGELDAEGLAARRAHWHAAWSPAAPWPPTGPVERLQDRLGESLPERWFAPLKEAEAAAAGLPVWSDGPDLVPPGAPPPTWADLAQRFLGLLAGGDDFWDDGSA